MTLTPPDKDRREDNECVGHLVFLFLMTGILGMDEECNRHIFSLLFQVLPRKIIFFMTGSVRKDRSKERTGHLIFLFLLSGYRSCRQCILSFFVMAAMTQLSTEDFGVLQVT